MFRLTAPLGSSTGLMVMVRLKFARLMVTSSAVPRTPSGPGKTMHSTPPLGQVTPAVVVQAMSSAVPTNPSGPAHSRGCGPLLKEPPLDVLAIALKGICWLLRAV